MTRKDGLPRSQNADTDPAKTTNASGRRIDRGLRVVDSPRLGVVILVIGLLLSLLAALIAAREGEREEHLLWQADTAPFRSAVEREIGKYGALQAVAQLAADALGNDSSEGVRTQLLGDTLERLYPAVSFAAFVRVVGKEAAGDYLRNRGLSRPLLRGPAGTKVAAATSGGTQSSRHYFLESISPKSPRGLTVGTDLGTISEFAGNLDLATRTDSLLVTRERVQEGRALPGALVIFSIDRPPVPASTSESTRNGPAAKSRLHATHQADMLATPRPPAAPAKVRQALQEPFGFLIVGIDMARLMNDAMRELPTAWHARLTALSGTGEPQQAAGAGDAGRLLFDSHLEMASGLVYPPVRPPLRMDPYRFEAWGSLLRLDMEGHEDSAYPFLGLMAWLVFFAGILLTLGLYLALERVRQARSRVLSLADEARTSTERFRDIVETSSDWIWEVDARQRFTYLSPTTEALLGYSPQELIGTDASALLAPSTGDAVPVQFFPASEGEVQAYTGFERKLRCKDGAEVVVEGAGTPIRDADDRVIGYRGIDRDVTQQREFRQRLSQLHEDLARHMQSNLAGQLLSGLAHELNQPLAAIMTYNQACLRLMKSGNADPAEIAAAMQSTADNVLHARDILQRLRRFTARREPQAVPTPLEPLVKSCLALVEIRLRSLSVETRINIFSTTPAVLVDPILATQVLLNVFNNAIDAMSESDVRRIEVRAHVLRGRTVQVRISDSGPGIAPEDLPRLFDAYFTTKPEGTGIGLPLCRSIIEAMGGSIKVSSQPGKGAVVELEFPVARRN